jgi:YD repeat-containing protein
VALAALGLGFTDPLDAMALAVGEGAVASPAPAPATLTAVPDVGSPPVDDPSDPFVFITSGSGTDGTSQPQSQDTTAQAAAVMVPPPAFLDPDDGFGYPGVLLPVSGSPVSAGSSADALGPVSGGFGAAAPAPLVGGGGVGDGLPAAFLAAPAVQAAAPAAVGVPAAPAGTAATAAPAAPVPPTTAGAAPAQAQSGAALLTVGGEVLVEAVDWVASEGGQSTGVFRFTRLGDATGSLTVNYLVSGNAVNGEDYESLSGSVDFADGERSVAVMVTPLADGAVERPEAVTVTLYRADGTLSDRSATVSIRDDDDLGGGGGGTVRLGAVALADGAETGPEAVFAVTRSGGDLSQSLVVTYTLGGSALPEADYVAPSGSVTFAPGQSAVPVRVSPIDSPDFRPTRTVVLGGLAAVGTEYLVDGPGTAVVSLADRYSVEEEPRAAVVGVVASRPATEEGGVGEFTFIRSGADLSRPLAVEFSVTGTAGFGSDYTLPDPTPTVVRFAPYASAATVLVRTLADAETESDETVTVTLLPSETVVADQAAATAAVLIGTGSPPSSPPVAPSGGQAAEILVNTYTANSQTEPAVAATADGSLVVVWSSQGQDGSSTGIYGRRYDASGAAGPEFRVNTYTTGIQFNPAVAAVADGGFVVAWQSLAQDGSGWGVYAQRYDASGAAAGPEFRVNTHTASDQSQPAVAAVADGGFVVAWRSWVQDGSGWGVYAQRYDASGAAAGPEFRVNTHTTDDQSQPAVAAAADGGFVVAWRSRGQGGPGWGVYARRYDASGAGADEFRIDTLTQQVISELSAPAVAAAAGGGFIVAWDVSGPDGSFVGVYARRYDAALVAVQPEFQVNTYTTDAQWRPAVAATVDGGFVVAWQSHGQDGSFAGVYAQRYDASGAAAGPEFRVNTHTTNNQILPVVASDDGGFVVVWAGAGPGDTSGESLDGGIFITRYLPGEPPLPLVLTQVLDPVSSEYQASTGRFRVVRLGGTAEVTVSLSASGDAATGMDYATLPGTATVPATTPSVGLAVLPATDETDEPTEYVRLTLGPVAGYVVNATAPHALIVDRDAPHLPGQNDRTLAPTGLAMGGDVRPVDGVIGVEAADITTGGYGTPWGHRRQWSNDPRYSAGGPNGNGWAVLDLPQLTGDQWTVRLVAGTDELVFDYAPLHGYRPRFFVRDRLVRDATARLFTLYREDGSRFVFNDLSASHPARPGSRPGQFLKHYDPYGNLTEVKAWAFGQISHVQREGTADGQKYFDAYLYAWNNIGGGRWRLGAVTQRRHYGPETQQPPTVLEQWRQLRQVIYSYYDGSTEAEHGNAGDLKTAEVRDAESNTLDTFYYRYYTTTGVGRYKGGLKAVYNPGSVARMRQEKGLNAFALPDDQIGQYADLQLEYVKSPGLPGGTHQVSKRTVRGGSTAGPVEFGYTYRASEHPDGFNSWAVETVVVHPDGHSRTYYSNAYGQVMLSVVEENSGDYRKWRYYTRFDDRGRAVMTAGPSVVSYHGHQFADLVKFTGNNAQYLEDGKGLVVWTRYYDTTTATATTRGQVRGKYESTSVSHGEVGEKGLIDKAEYFDVPVFGGAAAIAPLARNSVFRGEGGGQQADTDYRYDWHQVEVDGGGDPIRTARAKDVYVGVPVVGAAQNGRGDAGLYRVETVTRFDRYGNATWFRDPDGIVHHQQFHIPTGTTTKVVMDASLVGNNLPDKPTDWAPFPSAFPVRGDAPAHVQTDIERDDWGRPKKIVSPNAYGADPDVPDRLKGNVTYHTYDDVKREVRTYAGWDPDTNRPLGPTLVAREDRARGYVESLSMTAAPVVDAQSGRPSGGEGVSGVQTLTRTQTTPFGQPTAVDTYFNLTGVTHTTEAAHGTEGGNFVRARLGTAAQQRASYTTTPAGTTVRTEYDVLGRPVRVVEFSGPGDPFRNLSSVYDVARFEYDNGVVGDGNLTKVTEIPGGGAADRVTQTWYDWRNRPVAVKSGVEATEADDVNRPLVYTVYNNLGEVTEVLTYDADSAVPNVVNEVPQRLDSAKLRAKVQIDYDDRGRAYRTREFSVNQETGVAGAHLTTNTWYTNGSQVAKVVAPGGMVTKYQYDGLKRVYQSALSDGGGDVNDNDHFNLTGDFVLTKTNTEFDKNGNTISVRTWDRAHTETGLAGATPLQGRTSYQEFYYDGLDRLVAEVDVGTNNGAFWTRPVEVPTTTPSRLVTRYDYSHPAGWLQEVTDPAGFVTHTEYDAAGRTKRVIEQFTETVLLLTGTADPLAPSEFDNRVTGFEYDEKGRLSKRTTYRRNRDAGQVEAAATRWVYSPARPDLVERMEYPDPVTGIPTATQAETYNYNSLGETTSVQNRGGTLHIYSRDALGRVVKDEGSGGGVDTFVQSITTGYDTLGNVARLTSLGAGGVVRNEVVRYYNGFGQLVREWQSHTGAVDRASAPKVEYHYTEAANGANHSRLIAVAYPGGTFPGGPGVTYSYGTGIDDRVSRVSSIGDGLVRLEDYKYLGADTVVVRDLYVGVFGPPDLTYTHVGVGTGGGGGQYTGLDAFGRVTGERWVRSDGTETDKYVYGYDLAGRVTYRDNLVNIAFGEVYHYDVPNEPNRLGPDLTGFERGVLNDDRNGVVGTTTTRTQAWRVDGAGNWDRVTTDGVPQPRAHNLWNQIISLGAATDPTYDAAGNMTRDEQGRLLTYDAWDRLVRVTEEATGTVLAAYTYDGLGRRVTETMATGAAEGVIGGGFETPAVGPGGIASPGPGSGSPWAFTPSAGVSGNGSGFTSGNPDAPEGDQVTFLQNAGSVTQSATLAAGTYTLTFRAAQRGNYNPGGDQTIRVLVNGVSVGDFTPAGAGYQTFTTAAFTVAGGGTTSISFQGLGSGDSTALLDDVRAVAAAPPALADGGFEAPGVGAGNFQSVPTGTAWTYTGAAGVSAGGSGFTAGNPDAPEGVQVAFLQSTGSAAQTVGGLAAGTYTLTFQAAQRGNYNPDGPQSVRVLVDGTVVGTFTPAGAGYEAFTGTFTLAGAGPVGVRLEGVVGGDATVLVDDVQISADGPVSAAPGAVTTHLYHDGADVVEERVDGVTRVTYVYNPDGQLVLRDRDLTGDGVADERLWVQQDADGNVTALLNGQGQVVERFAYDPYGLPLVLDAGWQERPAGSAYGWRYLAGGDRYDARTGLYWSGGGDYSPTLGREVQRPVEGAPPAGSVPGQEPVRPPAAAYEHSAVRQRLPQREPSRGEVFVDGLRTGLKANVNAAASTVVSTVSINTVQEATVWAPTQEELADGSYQQALTSARVGYEIFSSVVPTSWAGKAGAVGGAARTYIGADRAANAAAAVEGAADWAANGASVGNVLQTVGGGLGVPGVGRAVGKAAYHTVNAPLSVAVHGGLGRVSTRAHDFAAAHLNRLGFQVCFAAGTPLRTPAGSASIEDLRPGDLVLSRDERDPAGAVEAKVVEEVFAREGLVWHLHLPGGVVVRTTAEHPFYRAGDGWVACHDLKPGDLLLAEDGTWAAVEDLLDTGEWEAVYNLRVADHHTYFVGKEEWGFSVWAHNRCSHDALKAMSASERRAHFAKKGYSLSELGPSGFPKRHVVTHSTHKSMREAGKGTNKGVAKDVRGQDRRVWGRVDRHANSPTPPGKSWGGHTHAGGDMTSSRVPVLPKIYHVFRRGGSASIFNRGPG